MKYIVKGIGIYILTWITLMIILIIISKTNSSLSSIDALGHAMVILFTVLLSVQLIILKEIRNIKEENTKKDI